MHTSLLSAAFALFVLVSTSTVHAQTYGTTSSAPARATTDNGSAYSRATTTPEEHEQGTRADPVIIDVQADSMDDPSAANTDVYLELDGVGGETSNKPGVEPDEIDNKMTDEDAAKKKDNVEHNWKVEEGQKTPSVEPDEIDVADEAEPTIPGFDILFSGYLDHDDDGDTIPTMDEEVELKVEKILLDEMQAKGVPVESITLNFAKIEMVRSEDLKLFGFIPVSASTTIEIDTAQNVIVSYPWWSFLATGKDEETVGKESANYIGIALMELRDALKATLVR